MGRLTTPPLKEPDIVDATAGKYDERPPSIQKGHGSSVLHIGPPQSGKSTLLSNLLLRFYCDEASNSLFDDIYIFSSSILLGGASTAALGPKYEPTIFTNPNTADMHRILDYQGSFHVDPLTGVTDRPSIAIVLDALIPWGLKRNSVLYTLAPAHRHHGVSLLLYLSQKFRSLPPIIRPTVGHLWCHHNGNAKEIEAIAGGCHVHRPPGGTRGFGRVLAQATAKSKHDFLNLRLLGRTPAARRCFQEVLYQGSDNMIVHRGAAPGKMDHEMSDEN